MIIPPGVETDLGPEVRGGVVASGRVRVLVIVLRAGGGGPREGVSQHPLASSLCSSPNISLKHEQILSR